METKQAYESLIRELGRQLDAEMPLAKEADDTLVAKGLLTKPSEAAELFTDSIDGYVDRLVAEVDSPAFNTHRYTVALYQKADEAALCDAIADLGEQIAAAGRAGGAIETAQAYSRLVVPAMGRMRTTADALEVLVPQDQWPFPCYSEILYNI